jgi:hypothetical protein
MFRTFLRRAKAKASTADRNARAVATHTDCRATARRTTARRTTANRATARRATANRHTRASVISAGGRSSVFAGIFTVSL